MLMVGDTGLLEIVEFGVSEGHRYMKLPFYKRFISVGSSGPVESNVRV